MSLPLDIETLRRDVSRGTRFEYCFFWGHRQQHIGAIDKCCLSQWFPAEFEIDGQVYSSAEHFMMAEKARLFGDEATLQEIVVAPQPSMAKRLGRRVQGFVESVWQHECFDIVVRGNLAKFSQNPEMGAFLKSTHHRIIVEASPVDRVWGIGMARDHEHIEDPNKWRGRNLLGFALMAVRAKLS